MWSQLPVLQAREEDGLLEHAPLEWVSLNLGDGLMDGEIEQKRATILSWPRPIHHNQPSYLIPTHSERMIYKKVSGKK